MTDSHNLVLQLVITVKDETSSILASCSIRSITEYQARAESDARPDQVEAVRERLSIGPCIVDQLAARFQRKPVKAVQAVLDTLEAMNLAHRIVDHWQLN